MIHRLGAAEAQSILAERENIEVGCDFCGLQYQFDAVDAAQLFVQPGQMAAGRQTRHRLCALLLLPEQSATQGQVGRRIVDEQDLCGGELGQPQATEMPTVPASGP